MGDFVLPGGRRGALCCGLPGGAGTAPDPSHLPTPPEGGRAGPGPGGPTCFSHHGRKGHGQLFTVKGQPVLAGPSGPRPTEGGPRPSLVEKKEPRPDGALPAPSSSAAETCARDGSRWESKSLVGVEAPRQPCRHPQSPLPPCPSAEAPPGAARPGPERSFDSVLSTKTEISTKRSAARYNLLSAHRGQCGKQLLFVCVGFPITEAQPNTGNGPRRDLGAQRRAGPAGRKAACVYLNVLG